MKTSKIKEVTAEKLIMHNGTEITFSKGKLTTEQVEQIKKEELTVSEFYCLIAELI